MSDKSAIEWTDATWPIVQGCDPVSQGCVHCYAVRLLWRMMHNPDPKISGPLQGLVEKHINAAGEEILRFTGKLALREDRLDWPLQWKKPRMIFVPSHGDIFHKDVPDEFIDKIFAVMALCPQHTFQVLTKRAERMRQYLSSTQVPFDCASAALIVGRHLPDNHLGWSRDNWKPSVIRGCTQPAHWPLPNVWLGISAERQEEWDERKEHLRNTPAAVRFASFEPLLGGIVEPRPMSDFIQWAIVGGESGKDARPMHPDWARSLHAQCEMAGVPFFFKQWGAHQPTDVFGANDTDVCLDGQWFARVGKKAAGRLLDGREHNAFPVTDVSDSQTAVASHERKTEEATHA